MSPTAFTAGLVAAIALAAFVVPVGVAGLALVALLGATVADALIVRRRPHVARQLPQVLSRGVPAPLLVTVEAPAGVTVRIRQAVPGDLVLEPPEVDGRRLEAELTARRRGRHVLAPAAVRLRGPLGLAAWIHDCCGEAAVDVYPDLPAARRAALAARQSRYRDPGQRGRGPLGLGTEFEAVREYQPDDDIRQVNWRATARLGKPMSNDYRLEQDRDVICALDAGRLMQAPLGDRTRLDAAVDAAAAVAAVADEVGDRFGVVGFDAEQRVWLPPSRAGGGGGVRALYDLEPRPTDSDYAGIFQLLEREKRALVLVFTDLVEEVAARPLVAAMPVLARKHAVAIVSATDLELDAAVGDEPETVGDVLRASVALEVLEGRARAAAVCRSVGGEVVEAPAERLAAACVAAYMRAKARARL